MRAWFRYMFVSQDESARIRHEWQSRFDALPKDNDIEELADCLKLVWADLPRRETASRQPLPCSV